MSANAGNRGLDTGHPAIDEQHQQLLSAYDRVLEEVRGGDAQAAWAGLQELVRHTERHFAYEESRMAESGYGARERHLEGHRAFLHDLDQLVEQARRDPCAPVVRLWLESRYVSWWKYHVRSNDAALASHLAAAQPASPAGEPGPAAAPGDKVQA